MLTEAEIEALAGDLESFRVERKQGLADKSTIEEAICAFANDLPGLGEVGVLLIGVHDKTGLPVGLEITDQLLRTLTEIRSSGNILPLPIMTVYKASLQGREIAVIEVVPGKDLPFRVRGRVCVRVGPRKDTASRDEERILTERRRGFDGPFDQRAVVGCSLDDLDLISFEREYLPNAVTADVLRENGRSVPEQLAGLHLASVDGVPNVAGVLVLGRAPTAWLPGAYVQFLRIDGTELTDPIVDRKEISGPLPGVLRRLDEVAEVHIRVATDVTRGSVEARSPDYPWVALQQLLRNAIMHRNYETSYAPVQWYWFADRVEIHNPGGLFGRANRETFGKPGGNDYRNPTVAAAMRVLGFVQQFGLGVPLARKACVDNGNPTPEFLIEGSSFAVIVRIRK